MLPFARMPGDHVPMVLALHRHLLVFLHLSHVTGHGVPETSIFWDR